MVDKVLTIESFNCVWYIGFSTKLLQRKKKGSMGMLTFKFKFLIGAVISKREDERVLQGGHHCQWQLSW